jgi:hypothetical protein
MAVREKQRRLVSRRNERGHDLGDLVRGVEFRRQCCLKRSPPLGSQDDEVTHSAGQTVAKRRRFCTVDEGTARMADLTKAGPSKQPEP